MKDNTNNTSRNGGSPSHRPLGGSNLSNPNHSKSDKLVINPKDPNDKWIFSLDEVMSAVPEPRLWHFFLKGAMNAIVASSEAGKTTFVRNITNAIINAESKFLGWDLRCKRNQVILVSTEDGLHSHKDHFERINSNLDERVGDVRFIIDSHNLINKLDVALKHLPADIVFIDTWGDAVSGDFDNKMTRGFLKEIRTVCMKYGTTPVVIHHTNKGADNIPHKSSIKGAGDFEQALRSVLFLTVFQERRYLGLVKGNDHNEEDKKFMYQVDFDPSTERISIDHNNKIETEFIRTELRREMHGIQNKKEYDWDAVFEGEKLTHSALVQKIMKTDSIKDSGAKKRIRVALADGSIEKENDKYSV